MRCRAGDVGVKNGDGVTGAEDEKAVFEVDAGGGRGVERDGVDVVLEAVAREEGVMVMVSVVRVRERLGDDVGRDGRVDWRLGELQDETEAASGRNS